MYPAVLHFSFHSSARATSPSQLKRIMGAASIHSHDKHEEKHEETTTVDLADERAYALRMARAADPGPRFASLAFMHYLFIALIACSVSGDVGFDGTIISSVNSMVQFQEFFGLGEGGASGQGLVFVSSSSRCSRWRLTPRASTLSARSSASSPASSFRTSLGAAGPSSWATPSSSSARS